MKSACELLSCLFLYTAKILSVLSTVLSTALSTALSMDHTLVETMMTFTLS